jgi:hypothetical protein
MSAFIIEVADTKDGVIYPDIIGPFKDGAEAEAFAVKFGLGLSAEMGAGGYSAYHIVSENTCDYTPDKYAEAYDWKLEQPDEET